MLAKRGTAFKDLPTMVEAAKAEIVMVYYDEIIVLDEICVRRKINPVVVKEYASAYENNAPMPPLMLLRMEQGLVLVDGYHRYHALCSLASRMTLHSYAPDGGVPCNIIGRESDMSNITLEDARYLHYLFNRVHGLRLNRAEQIEGRKRYFEAEMYRNSRGKVKSLREISVELGVAHTTVQRFVAKYFRHLRKLWAREYPRAALTGNNPEGFNGLLRKDKSVVACAEILSDIGRIKGKSQFVKVDSREYRDMCRALLALTNHLCPDGNVSEGCDDF